MLVTTSFVSQVMGGRCLAANGLHEILDQAQARYTPPSITGAMMFTGTYLVKTIEGPKETIEKLMLQLRADPRHAILAEFGRKSICTRRYTGLNLAYAGLSVYVSRAVERVLTSADAHSAQAAIKGMMMHFATKHPTSS